MKVGEAAERANEGPGYQRLVAWQKAMNLVELVYQESKTWPKEELYGLTSQARRAAVAVPSNLAEGHGRTGPREFAHHVSIAYGSLCELETQVQIAQRLGYAEQSSIDRLMISAGEVRRLTRGLLNSLRQPSIDTARG